MHLPMKAWSGLVAGMLMVGLPGGVTGLDGVAVAQTVEDRKAEAERLYEESQRYFYQGQFQESLKYAEQALAIYRAIEDQWGESHSLYNIGNSYLGMGRAQQAIVFFDQIIVIISDISDRNLEGRTLASLGGSYLMLGQYERAIELLEQALEIVREIEEPKIEGMILTNLGSSYMSLSQYNNAIGLLEQALEVTRGVGDRKTEGSILSSLGTVYLNLGQYEKSIDIFKQALIIARETSDGLTEGFLNGHLGTAYGAIDQEKKAFDFYQESLQIARSIGDLSGESTALRNLGVYYRDVGALSRSISIFEESLSISESIKDQQGQSYSLSHIAIAYRYLGEYEKAIAFYKQSLILTRETNNRRDDVADTLRDIGWCLLNLGRYSEAEQHLVESIDLYESISADLQGNDTGKVSFFDETYIKAYLLLQVVQIFQDKTIAAFETSERGRARALSDLLVERLYADNPSSQGNPPNFAQIKQIAKAQNATIVEYSVSYRGLIFYGKPGVEAIRETDLYIWVITPNGEVTFRQVDITPIWRDSNLRLRELVQITRESIGVRGTRTDASPELRPNIIARRQAETDQKLRQLHQFLIEPIADLLPPDPEAKVVFVPQESLFSVPFPALKDADGNYLIEKHTILTAPSIQTLQFTRAAKARKTNQFSKPLLVGNPIMPTVTFLTENGFEDAQLTSLPGAQQEAKAIGDFLQTPALVGSAATEATVKQQIETANLIHFATHGLLEYGDPQQTGSRDVPGAIALTPGNGEDGLLTSSEILDLNLSADLVVLSACDTGRGRITGDGVIGLSRSFISAGVPSIIVSLWQVPDAPTAELMTEFYRQRAQTGDNAQALRQAMLSTMQTHPDPKNWAAFTLIGESQ